MMLCNPCLGNSSVNMFPQEQICKATVEEECFLYGSCQEVITRTVAEMAVQLSSARETGRDGAIIKMPVSCQQLLESQPVKSRLGCRCEMAASLAMEEQTSSGVDSWQLRELTRVLCGRL